ncbi:unnamed protein product [Haemonchus placei]|uniref:Amidase domain-containing protein n=1 Tax=Haemonchus placei TaxID=6290 RepID=A0A0N4WZE2_HAEPC|nr:unnamed protein product [Haemonchus placei]
MGLATELGILMIHIYFVIVHTIFVIINYFVKKRSVPAPFDDVVMLSATDAVKKIKRRELLRRRPLYGVPFSCKDSIEINGQIVTTGSYYRRNHRCTKTGLAVQRMQDAGGILIAITNVPELCAWIETTNTVYGRTRNPYDLRRIVGGSSGGEGALLSAAGTPVGVGSDVGIIPIDGHAPEPSGYKRQMLREGPMCRYVEDIPLLYEIMAGERFKEMHMDEHVDFKKCRVFYMLGIRHPLVEPLGDVMKETLLKAVSHFESTFGLEGIGLDLPLTLYEPEFYSASSEGNLELSRKALSFEGDAGQLNVWKELPKVLTGQSHHTAAVLLITFMESLHKHGNEESNEKYIRIRDRLKRQIVETLGNNGILFFPSWSRPAPFHREPLFAVLNTAYTALFNALALPVVQCPMGLDKNGIPLGVQIVAAPGCDRLLIAAANEINAAFGGWRPAWEQPEQPAEKKLAEPQSNYSLL